MLFLNACSSSCSGMRSECSLEQWNLIGCGLVRQWQPWWELGQTLRVREIFDIVSQEGSMILIYRQDENETSDAQACEHVQHEATLEAPASARQT